MPDLDGMAMPLRFAALFQRYQSAGEGGGEIYGPILYRRFSGHSFR